MELSTSAHTSSAAAAGRAAPRARAAWAALPERRPEESGPAEGIDFADLIHKFTGWAWYTYAKIARGELFEAVNSLDCMRVRALLPCLQLLSGLPFEGYRRIEARLSKSGTAIAQPGDLLGRSDVVKPGARDVKIVIDQVVP